MPADLVLIKLVDDAVDLLLPGLRLGVLLLALPHGMEQHPSSGLEFLAAHAKQYKTTPPDPLP